MTIEATMLIVFEKHTYILVIKMIKMEDASYFFINDKEKDHGLLSGKTLELTWFADSFSLTEFGNVVKTPGVPQPIVLAIEEQILKNRQSWFL
jgi:hypothetical protein